MISEAQSRPARFAALDQARSDPAADLTLVTGGAGDYHALACHHYRAGAPATMARVLAFRDAQPTAGDRFLQRTAPSRTVAVLVESLPVLGGRMRDWALGGRYSAWPAGSRAALLNGEFRCISRVVVHPMYRGLGLAVRLVRQALATAPTPLTEAYAAMGRVHPFFEKAGMRAYPMPRHPGDARLLDALRRAGFEPVDLAMLDSAATEAGARPGLIQRIATLPADERAWLWREIRRWYRQTVGRGRDHSRDGQVQLRHAQQRLLLKPVYYLHDNREPGESKGQ
jgi:GNAT superfamily N-acetyltransferase